jgi:hypothetical protein
MAYILPKEFSGMDTLYDSFVNKKLDSVSVVVVVSIVTSSSSLSNDCDVIELPLVVVLIVVVGVLGLKVEVSSIISLLTQFVRLIINNKMMAFMNKDLNDDDL